LLVAGLHSPAGNEWLITHSSHWFALHLRGPRTAGPAAVFVAEHNGRALQCDDVARGRRPYSRYADA
jgi:hypothetical protein